MRTPVRAGANGPQMVESALRFAPSCYQLWLAAAAAAAQPQAAAMLLRRGVLALCQQSEGAERDPVPEAQAAAALDLALRLMLLLAEMHAPLAADRCDELLRFCLGSAAPPAGAPSPEAEALLVCRAALGGVLGAHPRLHCVLLLCCAHAATYGCLPNAALHRLGYAQQLQPLAWEHGALVPGGAGAAVAVLREPARELAQGVHTAEQLEARSVLALSLLRLDLATGSTMLLDAEQGSGVPGKPDAPHAAAPGGAAHAALRLVERWYRQLKRLGACPAALVVLLQEGVAAAVGSGTSAHAGLLRACVRGEVHPEVAAALAAAAVAHGAPPGDAAELLECWAAGYCNSSEVRWPRCGTWGCSCAYQDWCTRCHVPRAPLPPAGAQSGLARRFVRGRTACLLHHAASCTRARGRRAPGCAGCACEAGHLPPPRSSWCSGASVCVCLLCPAAPAAWRRCQRR